MDWSILVSVVIGGLIAIIPILINNRFQSKERDKDRQESRKETKIQTREKWVQRDILQIMDSVEKMLIMMAEYDEISQDTSRFLLAKNHNLLTQKEYKQRVKSIFDQAPKLSREINQSMAKTARLVNSFEENEIRTSYTDLVLSVSQLLYNHRQSLLDEITRETTEAINVNHEWTVINIKAGKFQQALREKLISIRDT